MILLNYFCMEFFRGIIKVTMLKIVSALTSNILMSLH